MGQNITYIDNLKLKGALEANVIKLFTDFRKKLECLSLAGLSSLV